MGSTAPPQPSADVTRSAEPRRRCFGRGALESHSPGAPSPPDWRRRLDRAPGRSAKAAADHSRQLRRAFRASRSVCAARHLAGRRRTDSRSPAKGSATVERSSVRADARTRQDGAALRRRAAAGYAATRSTVPGTTDPMRAFTSGTSGARSSIRLLRASISTMPMSYRLRFC